jgi:hypothetical protein
MCGQDLNLFLLKFKAAQQIDKVVRDEVVDNFIRTVAAIRRGRSWESALTFRMF